MQLDQEAIERLGTQSHTDHFGNHLTSTSLQLDAGHSAPSRPQFHTTPVVRRDDRRRVRSFLMRHERTSPSTKGHAVNPSHIPERWANNSQLTFEAFCELIRTPQRTVRDWQQRGVGPRWARFESCGRRCIVVGGARRFLSSETATRTRDRADG